MVQAEQLGILHDFDSGAHGSSTNASLNRPGTSRTGVVTFDAPASSAFIVASRSGTEKPTWSMALPALGVASALRRNMKRVLPNISRSGASAMRLPPKCFSYQLAPAAGSGTFR